MLNNEIQKVIYREINILENHLKGCIYQVKFV